MMNDICSIEIVYLGYITVLVQRCRIKKVFIWVQIKIVHGSVKEEENIVATHKI